LRASAAVVLSRCVSLGGGESDRGEGREHEGDNSNTRFGHVNNELSDLVFISDVLNSTAAAARAAFPCAVIHWGRTAAIRPSRPSDSLRPPLRATAPHSRVDSTSCMPKMPVHRLRASGPDDDNSDPPRVRRERQPPAPARLPSWRRARRKGMRRKGVSLGRANGRKRITGPAEGNYRRAAHPKPFNHETHENTRKGDAFGSHVFVCFVVYGLSPPDWVRRSAFRFLFKSVFIRVYPWLNPGLLVYGRAT